MSLTGELIKFGGVATLSIGSTVFLFLASRIWSFFYRFKELEEEFENLWHESIELGMRDEKLTNLSYVHKAVRRQMENSDTVNDDLLERAIREAEENKAITKGKRGQLYYVASEKLRDLEKEAKQAGKI
ncbi:MAG: hypothetical protein ACLFTY_03820 [Candidatus Aenigmatarchaeota archaeon]